MQAEVGRTPEEREFLSVDEAATLLGVSRNTLYEAVKQDQVPGALHIRKRIVIRRQALIDAAMVCGAGEEA